MPAKERLTFLHAFKTHSLSMLKRAKTMNIFDVRYPKIHKHNPLVIDKQVCISRLLDYLDDFKD